MAAGALFGVGFALSTAGLLLGALAAFRLRRSAGESNAQMSGRSQLRNLDAALGRDGWRWFACCASPLTPLVATRFPLGLSAISLRDYMLGALAALPALLGYVSLGASARPAC